MSAEINPDILNASLPTFRRDLELYRGPTESDGSPTYNLYDPIVGQYFKIGWKESLIFKFLKKGMSLETLINTLHKYSTLKISPEDVLSFFQDARRLHLLAISESSETIHQEYQKKKINPLKWLLLHYLYIRIPVLNPDVFLGRTLGIAKFFWSPLARVFYLIVTLLGILFLTEKWDDYLHTFPYFFNLDGVLIYGLMMTAIKVIHEFSHAYTAKNYGIHVRTMGVLFMVLWPVLYTDVTDAWKLKRRRERLAISVAGITAELVLAGLSTFAWTLSSPGLFQSICFVVSSVTWIKTLLINCNPAMRFDGYYILGDLWGIDNLQPRSFALARWKIRQWILGLYTPPPEEGLGRRRVLGMTCYAVYCWLYRLFLYTAIAVFIYFRFTKALGIFLFLVEIGFFIVWPISSELKEIYHYRSMFRKNLQGVISLLLLGVLLFWLLFPLPHKESFSAVIAPIEQEDVYVPVAGVIKNIWVKRGDIVKEGQPLIEIDSAILDAEIADLKATKELVEKQIELLSLKDTNRPFLPQKADELARTEESLKGAQEKQKRMKIQASIEGEVYLWDENLKKNQFVYLDQVLGRIADTKQFRVIFFVPEHLLRVVHENQTVEFRGKNVEGAVKGVVESIYPIRAAVLRYPALASVFRGDLPVASENGPSNSLRLVESYYPVYVKVTSIDTQDPLRFGEGGYVYVEGPWRSKFMEWMNKTMGLFWRESGF